MRMFVASWFFPPATSSEGIVTYKLLRNSSHTYDVCSANSNQWGYKHTLPLNADNIRVFAINTDDLEIWVSEAIATFEREHAIQPYEALMTRSMPPESIKVALAIKEKYPSLPWIASLADPIARNPYWIKDMILENENLRDDEKWNLQYALINGFGADDSDDPLFTLLKNSKEIEDAAINKADCLIFPCETQKNYMLGTRVRKHAYAVPHSFDHEIKNLAEVSPKTTPENTDSHEPIVFNFLGHTDHVRSLKPLVLALNHIRCNTPEVLNKILVRCIGNVPSDIRDLIFNFHLHNVVRVEKSVDYLTSLNIMDDAQWLIHVDAYFEQLAETGGSIFFAGKIADYMATGAPIFGMTGANSPAANIIEHAGGIVVDPTDIPQLAKCIQSITEGKTAPKINRAYRDTYTATYVAQKFDNIVATIITPERAFSRTYWPTLAIQEDTEIVLSICIPSYNVESYLDRCLLSLVSCEHAVNTEIIVVNDGSKDNTEIIAEAYANQYPGTIKVINKKNGGHGSTINAALEIAQGRYFRVLDGDDWVDPKDFDSLINNILTKSIDTDIISSNYYQVYFEDGHTVAWEKKGNSEFYRPYDFAQEDFTMEYFTMAATMFKTEILRKANFKIQEHTFYVDVEYLLYPIPYSQSVCFAPEFVYRYAVGNADQSINPAMFTSRYDHHDRVIRRMLTYYHDHKYIMGSGQNAYMRSLFDRHLLQSHYLLSLVWDPDQERGLKRAKDFDAFLKNIDETMWAKCAQSYPAVRVARKKGFDPGRLDRLTSLDDRGLALRKHAIRVARRLKKTSFADKLAANERIRNLYHKIAAKI